MVDDQIVVVDAVEEEVIRNLPGAIGAQRQPLTRNQRVLRVDLHARREIGEVHEVALVQRQVFDLDLTHDQSNR